MPAKKLLVNADDLGLSSAINTGIVNAHLRGIVTSASIVASGQAFEEATRLALVHSTLAVGVHLTLVEENSVCPPDKVPTLAPHGVLPRTYGELVKHLLTGRIRLIDIEREFRAQIEKCLLAGIKPTHLDSHQHTHALPLIFPIAVRLANDYNIPGIRIPRCLPAFQDIASDRFLPKCALCLFAYADAAVFSLGQCVATSRFTGLFASGALTEPQLLHILDQLRSGTTELVCHPGCDDPSPRYASWNQRRQIELDSLTGTAAKQRVAQLGIELINYRQL
jgi:predicted glycoside hydrolase/deacetylase ChbG (UPF0249 family)